jgi:hypothetical protein
MSSKYLIQKLNELNYHMINLYSFRDIIKVYLYKFVDYITNSYIINSSSELSKEISLMIEFLNFIEVKDLHYVKKKDVQTNHEVNLKYFNIILSHIKYISRLSHLYKKIDATIFGYYVDIIKTNGNVIRSIINIKNNDKLLKTYKIIDDINIILSKELP